MTTEWKVVPVEPTAEQSDELARDIIMWWSMSPPTGDALYRHLKRLGREVPPWLPTMIRDAMYVPPKGVVTMAIYRAMLDAAPVQAQGEPVAWVRNLTDPQPHCVTGLQYRTAADCDAGVQYIPVYTNPPRYFNTEVMLDPYSQENGRLSAEIEQLKLQRAAAELVHRETATTVLTQMAEIERLRAALEEVLVYGNGAKGFIADSVRKIAHRALRGE